MSLAARAWCYLLSLCLLSTSRFPVLFSSFDVFPVSPFPFAFVLPLDFFRFIARCLRLPRLPLPGANVALRVRGENLLYPYLEFIFWVKGQVCIVGAIGAP